MHTDTCTDLHHRKSYQDPDTTEQVQMLECNTFMFSFKMMNARSYLQEHKTSRMAFNNLLRFK